MSFYIGLKDINSTIQITTVFNDPETGAMATPDTSIKIRIYPANSDTEILEETSMSVKDSVTGYYYYAWDISSVPSGLYNYLIIAVHDSVTYGEKGSILILVSKAGLGNGGSPQIVNIKNTKGEPIAGAQCILYSTYAMTEGTEISGTQYSNSKGQVTWYLDKGTYYMKTTKANESFNNPLTITV
ncbi:MAG TPA: SpaA isopeptide-forming pilin-related protein [Candidatus Goldiibacteriota bacterium]|nr:SpaA isopeptide-forming pilin-related protein [Candidatus Goldiibacteriota bacterium]